MYFVSVGRTSSRHPASMRSARSCHRSSVTDPPIPGYRHRMRRSILIGSLAMAAGLTVAPVALAAPIDEVADSLRSDPVYVDPDAERALSESEAAEVREAIRDAGTPVYIAVLPAVAADSAGGDAGELASQVAESLAREGTIAVVVGDRFRAGSSELPAGRAGELANEALDSGGDDTVAVLTDFVGLIGEEATGGSSGGESARRPPTTAARTGCCRRCWSAEPAWVERCSGVRRRSARRPPPSGRGPRRLTASCCVPSCRCSPTTSCAWNPRCNCTRTRSPTSTRPSTATGRRKPPSTPLTSRSTSCACGGSSTRRGTRWTGRGR